MVLLHSQFDTFRMILLSFVIRYGSYAPPLTRNSIRFLYSCSHLVKNLPKSSSSTSFRFQGLYLRTDVAKGKEKLGAGRRDYDDTHTHTHTTHAHKRAHTHTHTHACKRARGLLRICATYILIAPSKFFPPESTASTVCVSLSSLNSQEPPVQTVWRKVITNHLETTVNPFGNYGKPVAEA